MSPEQALSRAEKAVRRGDAKSADEYLEEYWELRRDRAEPRRGDDRAARVSEKIDKLSMRATPKKAKTSQLKNKLLR